MDKTVQVRDLVIGEGRPKICIPVMGSTTETLKEGTQDVRKAIDVSESTLYPVLRRLLKDDCLEVYDMEFGGRNRRYYKITERGMAQLQLYKTEWKEYSARIGNIFDGGEL